ncbi:hypothetical protein JCM10212_006080 [Sporobolomyces blumeae]
MYTARLTLAALVAAGLALASPAPLNAVQVSGSVSSLILGKRAAASSSATPAVASSSYLQDLFGMETPQSETECSVPLADLETCANGTDAASIAACACSTQTLGDLRSCAAAISTTTTSSTNATAVVVAYNSFVDLCQHEGLATVTGTIAAGESTKSVARVSTSSAAPGSSSSSSAHPTYDAASTPASTATVPALTVGSQTAAASGANAAAATGTSAATRSFAAQGIATLGGAVGIAFLTLA